MPEPEYHLEQVRRILKAMQYCSNRPLIECNTHILPLPFCCGVDQRSTRHARHARQSESEENGTPGNTARPGKAALYGTRARHGEYGDLTLPRAVLILWDKWGLNGQF